MNIRTSAGTARCAECLDTCFTNGFTSDPCIYCGGVTLWFDECKRKRIVGRRWHYEFGFRVSLVTVDGVETSEELWSEEEFVSAWAGQLSYGPQYVCGDASWFIGESISVDYTPEPGVTLQVVAVVTLPLV
ncbi:hypothetical protein [Streptodolium elevatio]|uniref:Uncharacterized protein n=1 Tax=Streptodolium elevatio TaxID=3157996 RepID=A0ABV3DBX5_9ACTN